jgi:hypothetical protein
VIRNLFLDLSETCGGLRCRYSLGKLNDVKSVRAANPDGTLLTATLTSLAPFAIGLIASTIYFGKVYPAWLFRWLWISYGLIFVGELTAWWIPYLLRLRARTSGALSGDVQRNARFPARTKRYQAEHAACDPSLGDAHHLVCPRRSDGTGAA